MPKQIRFTFRINELLDKQITLLARRNKMSRNRFLNYIIEIGLNEYLKRFEKF